MVRTLITHVHPDWTIIEASNGQEALEKTATLPVDIMTIDLNMPGMDGLTLATTLRARYPVAHIALLTANIQESVRQKAAAAGVRFMEKPVTEESLSAYMACVSGDHHD
jgi:CheY-like chemotaxis protein